MHKDEILDRLALQGNVAQFVAFRTSEKAGLQQSFSRVAGHEPNELFFDAQEAISALLSASIEHRVNVRSYVPNEARAENLYTASTTLTKPWQPSTDYPRPACTPLSMRQSTFTMVEFRE